MVASIHAGLRQYELITSEKMLLEQTLKGSIEALVDILALTNPIAFSHAERIRYFVSQCVHKLTLENSWMYEIAAMLSQIGFVTIPPNVVEKAFADEELSDDEQLMMCHQVKDAQQMIERIPRLERVAQMIAHQNDFASVEIDDETVREGARLLRTVIDYEKYLSQGKKTYQAIDTMQKHPDVYAPKLLELLAHIDPPAMEQTVAVVHVHDLRLGMVLAEDILSVSNAIIVKKGQQVNGIMRRRLENFLQQNAIPDKIRIYQHRSVFL